MKTLYIFPQTIMNGKGGGSVVHKENYYSLVYHFGENNVVQYPIYRRGNTNKIRMFFNDILALGFGGLSNEDKKKMVSIIIQNDIKLVFIDSSIFGCLAGYLKRKTQVKVVVFFHNIEYDYWKNQIKLEHSYSHSYRIPLAKINESSAAKNSDVIITLTKKDSDRLHSLYGRHADHIIPVGIRDNFTTCNKSTLVSEQLNLLFFGSSFPPNLEAADILITQILPWVDADVLIAGKGMEVLKKKYSNIPKLTIHGYVDNISDMYDSADVVVMPIISGSGMKVKTAEALAYGKNIIATSNALEGYEVDGIAGIIRCDSVVDFINAIKTLDRSLTKYNDKARELFLSKYSLDSSFVAYKQVYDNLFADKV